MSPKAQIRGSKSEPANNIYTALLALAVVVVVATAAFVALTCQNQFGSFFKIP